MYKYKRWRGLRITCDTAFLHNNMEEIKQPSSPGVEVVSKLQRRSTMLCGPVLTLTKKLITL